MNVRRSRLVSILVAAGACLAALAAGAQVRGWPSESPPRPLASRGARFPPYETRKLPNGLQVVVVMRHEEPAVSLRLLIGAGSAQDPPGRQGLAALAASLLDQGSTSRSAGEIADAIDSIGGQLDVASGRDLTQAHVIVMKDSFELGMKLLSEVVRAPAFAEAEIERQRRQTLAGLKVSTDDPAYVASTVFDRIVYAPHPYGFPENGTPETVPQITRDDLATYHRAYFVPNNAILAVAGDATVEESLGVAQAVFGDWAPHDLPPAGRPAPAPPARRVVIVDKPDAVQTEIRVGQLGIRRQERDYLPLDLAMRILGGEGANRLHRVLRTERGLTYGAETQLETLREAGEFAALTNTRSEATPEVLRLIVDEVFRLKRERVSERELADAKAFVTGHFPLTIETPDQIGGQVIGQLFYGLPLDELKNFSARVNAVDVDELARVAEGYLQPDRLTVVLVGNAAAFADQLGAVGFRKYERIPIADLDLTRADLRRAESGRGSAPGMPAPTRLSAGAEAPAHTADVRVRPTRIAFPAAPGQGFPPAWGAPAPTRSVRRETLRQAAGARGDDRGPAQAPARALLDRVIAAKGGLARLRGIRTVVATAASTVQTPSGSVTSETKTYVEYPSRFRVEATTPRGNTIQVYADGEAWVKGPNGIETVAAESLDRFRAPVERDLISLLVRAGDGKLRVAIPDAAEASGPGSAQPLLLEISGEGPGSVRWVVDPASGLVLEQRYLEHRGPVAQPVREIFSDYRAVDGVMVAFRASIQSGNTTFAERRLRDIRFNVPVPPALFERPRR